VLVTQDGGISLDTKMDRSSTKKARSLMLAEELMMKAEMSLCTRTSRLSTNNGTLSTLMSIQMSQRRENSMNSSDFTLKDHSTLSQR